MKAKENNDKKEYETTCACRKCNKLATHCLRIAYINREGDFCNSCSKKLSDKGLVVYTCAIKLVIAKEFVKFPTDGNMAIQPKAQGEQK